jgi:BOS complex subunit NOMO
VTKRDKQVAPLAEVLLSLTGGNSYRNNTQAGDSGVLRFVSLTPGQYFLRPLLKEYVFEPTTKVR